MRRRDGRAFAWLVGVSMAVVVVLTATGPAAAEPVADIWANVTSGPAPLTVVFDGQRWVESGRVDELPPPAAFPLPIPLPQEPPWAIPAGEQ